MIALYYLELQTMCPLVPRKQNSLVSYGSAAWPQCAINKTPAVVQWTSSTVYGFCKRVCINPVLVQVLQQVVEPDVYVIQHL